MATTPTEPQSKSELKRGRVLEVTKELLAEGRNDEVMALVSQLLQRNAELERKQSPFKTREGIAAEQVVMLLDNLDQPHEPPSSPLGAGIRYFLNNNEPLRRFLENGEVPIDNGIVERLHVRAALTRKNYLFAGSDAGAERAAIAYTLLGSCQLADVDPLEYLADVMPRMTRRIRIADLPALLPAQWKAARVATA